MTNRWLKALSILLSLVLIFNLLPLSVLAAEAQAALLQEDTQSSAAADTEVTLPYERLKTITVVEEDISRRGEYSKEFVLNNGLRLAAVYAEPVHYQVDDQWKDIDNTLKAVSVKGISGYTNTAGSWQVYFPEKLSPGAAVSVTKDGYTVRFGMAGQLSSSGDVSVAAMGTAAEALAVSASKASAAQIKKVDLTAQKAAAQYPQTVLDHARSTLAYPAVYDNTEIVYDLSGNRLKESIVIAKYDATLWGYRYELDTGGLLAVLLEDNSIELRHPTTEEIIMVMPAPFMVDANNRYSHDIDVSLVQKGSGYVLSYYIPRQWLASADRAWPVVLDPVVEANNTRTNIQDITYSQNTTHSNNATTVMVGRSSAYGKTRIYLRYKNLPGLSASSVIVKASLTLNKPTTSANAMLVEAHKVSRYWTPTTINSGDVPTISTAVEDVVNVQEAGYYTWDITDIANEWYASTTHSLVNNIGFALKASAAVENGTADHLEAFSSSDGTVIPQLQLLIRDNTGLESYWDYTSFSAGRAGTGYIQGYSGNVVWVHEDMGFDGNRMPVSIRHVFNSGEGLSNNYGLGYGWRTNFHQTVEQATDNTYIWTDGDGTKHYFYYVAINTFQDEDNLGLTLTVAEDGYVIRDRYENCSVFDASGRLVRQIDNQAAKNRIAITYQGTSSLITQIQDGVDRVYAFTYDENGLLSRIDFKGTGDSSLYHVGYTYENSLLTKITYKDEKEATFTYTKKNLLLSVEDVDGYLLTFTYHTRGDGKPSRIITVAETQNGTVGSTTGFQYGYHWTKIQDDAENTQTSFFDQWGNTVSVQDKDGKAIVSKYTPVTEDNNTKNQLINASSEQISVNNLITDGSFESGLAWYGLNCVSYGISEGAVYTGYKSMMFQGSDSAIHSVGYALQGGKTYTFSAYVKTNTANAVHLEIVVGNTVVETSRANMITNAWTRLQMSYDCPSDQTVVLWVRNTAVKIGNTEPTAYVDCVQLECDANANRYNLLDNANFAANRAWTLGEDAAYATITDPKIGPLDTKVIAITGDPGKERRVSQTVQVNAAEGSAFVLGGWAKADSLPLGEQTNGMRTFSIKATAHFDYDTVSQATYTASFHIQNPNQWQYAAVEIVAPFRITEIDVELTYDYNAGTAYFDSVGLYKERLGDSYTYNERGNLTAQTDQLGNTTRYNYVPNTNKVSAILYPTAQKTEYTYWANSFNVNHEMQFVYKEGAYEQLSITTYTYDDYGNVIRTVTRSGDPSDEEIVQTTIASYANGNYLEGFMDEDGNITQYGYNADTGMLEWVQYPEDTEDTRTNYQYDNMYRLVSTSANVSTGSSMSADYTYEDDLLSAITTKSTVYTLNYGAFGLRTGIKAGNYTLASYAYTNYQQKLLKKLAYGNGDVVQYTYNSKGQVLTEKYTDTGRVITYTYNARDALATRHDSSTNILTRYFYDPQGRVTSTREENYRTAYKYDHLGNVTEAYEYISGDFYGIEYAYDEQNRPCFTQFGVLTNSTVISGPSVGYEYDNLNRIISRNYFGNIAEQIVYEDGSNRVQSFEVGGVTYIFDYDDNGNITSISNDDGGVDYTYDSQNQLIREDNNWAGKTFVWTYDTAGNITSEKEYAYTLGVLGTPISTRNYGYATDSWKDRLISYNGRTFTYDAIGNPLSDGIWSYTWQQGRQLVEMEKTGEKWEFTYDADGLRTQRKRGTLIYNYVYSDGVLRQMTCGTNKLVFAYGVDGRPYALQYNGTYYYYLLNLQGDVIGIADQHGATVVSYAYDAWGNILSISGTMVSTLGQLNPLRYRGYVYDTETGLYYVKTRYYNPEIGRWINADGLLSANHFIGLNLYAYCYNNPVSFSDETGQFAISAFIIASIIGGAIAGGVINTVSYLSTNEDPSVEGTILAAATGIVAGGLGGAAGALSKYSGALSLAAGTISGIYTAVTTDGSVGQKICAGVSSFMFTAGGAYLGSMIPLDQMGFGLTVAGNTIFGMTIGGYLENANIWVQQEIDEAFEKADQTKSSQHGIQKSGSSLTNPFCPTALPEVIHLYP